MSTGRREKRKRTERSGSTVPWAAVRPTQPNDFPAIIDLCRRVYPGHSPYGEDQLASHIEVFPEGQLTAVVPTADDALAGAGERVAGMAASLIVLWEDYEFDQNWRDFTAHGYFTNHDASGRTLYGAEIMTDPDARGRGVGSAIYRARDELLSRLGLLRIRAGARLRGYHRWADRLSPEDYVVRVVHREIVDPTPTFQLNRGFRVLAVVAGYLGDDPESLGHAAVIEKLNPELATPEHYRRGDPRYRAPD